MVSTGEYSRRDLGYSAMYAEYLMRETGVRSVEIQESSSRIVCVQVQAALLAFVRSMMGRIILRDSSHCDIVSNEGGS